VTGRTEIHRRRDVREQLLVEPGTTPDLAGRETRTRLGLEDKDDGHARLAELQARMFELQGRLWAEGQRALLLVLQGMDTSGKDGTIRRVFQGVNPQGMWIRAFGRPSEDELQRDYLWRAHRDVPKRGKIGIFNRSHYEDVGVVRVQQLVPEERWRARYHHIREFERLLVDEGTSIVKVWLHISRDEQRERLQARIDAPEKHWKFEAADIDARRDWDLYEAAYEEAIAETSTDHAPWFVVPADRKWVRDVAVATLLVETLEAMDPQPPPPDPRLSGLRVH
jgi:PPK2 family polyphosphate:nucleotide phosphotransferase